MLLVNLNMTKMLNFDLHWKYHNKLQGTCTKCQPNGQIEMKTKKRTPQNLPKVNLDYSICCYSSMFLHPIPILAPTYSPIICCIVDLVPLLFKLWTKPTKLNQPHLTPPHQPQPPAPNAQRVLFQTYLLWGGWPTHFRGFCEFDVVIETWPVYETKLGPKFVTINLETTTSCFRDSRWVYKLCSNYLGTTHPPNFISFIALYHVPKLCPTVDRI
jgi:hypothetical protein